MVNEEQQEYRATGTEFKHEDTTQVMRIRFIAGNRFPIYPTKDHKFVAKIGKAYGSYIGDYPVSVSGNSFEVKSSDLKGLDNGDYRLEIWESYIDSEGNTQTSIFPSPRAFVSFTINQNIEDTAWNLVKDISFQDIVNTAVVAAGQNIVVAGTNTLPAGSQASVVQKYEDGKNEFTFNIPQGIQGPAGPAATIHVTKTYTVPAGQPPVFKAIPKGDGNFDIEVGLPQGETGKAPVRGVDYWTDADQQAIKDDVTAIAGSVGQWGVRVPNLIKNSIAEYKKIPSTSSYQFATGAVTAGTKYTASIAIKNTPIDVKISVALYDSSWKWYTWVESQAQKDGLLTFTFTPDKNGFAQISIQSADKKTKLSCEYAKTMWNEGDYAPYTSSTKPYTVDSLAERLTALENKVEG